MVFDEADVSNLVYSKGLSKSSVDCPHCCFRWGLIAFSDCTGWLICLVPTKGVDDVYRAVNEARSIGLSVNIVSAIINVLMDRVEVKK